MVGINVLKSRIRTVFHNIAPGSTCVFLSYIFTRPKRECRFHVWSRAALSSFSSLDRFQNRLLGLVGHDIISTLEILTHVRDVASLSRSCRQFVTKYSNELNYFGHLQLETRHTTTTWLNHRHFPCVPNKIKKFNAFHQKLSFLYYRLPRE